MLGRLDLRACRELYTRSLPEPVDVLNLIHFRDRESYTRYAMGVAPILALSGASVRWAGTHDATWIGRAQAEELLVVRYPSHRHFLRMIANPYYLVINRFRVRGVSRFEASFTVRDAEAPDPGRAPVLWVVHLPTDAPRDRVAPLVSAGGRIVYASRATAHVELLREPQPSDPNPLSYGQVVFLEAPDESVPREALAAMAADDLVVSRYRRVSPLDLLRRS